MAGLLESLWSVTIFLDNKKYKVVLVLATPLSLPLPCVKLCVPGKESRKFDRYLGAGREVFPAFTESIDCTMDSVT